MTGVQTCALPISPACTYFPSSHFCPPSLPCLFSVLPSLSPRLFRHRSINLFLMGYQKLWIVAEEYSFEEKLVQDLAVSTGLASVLPRVPCVPAVCLAASTLPAETRERTPARLALSSRFGSPGCVAFYRQRHSRQALHEFRLSLSPRHLSRAVYLSTAVVRGAAASHHTLPLCLGIIFLS